MTPLLSIAEVSRLLAVSKITVRRLVNGGELPCIRLSKGGPLDSIRETLRSSLPHIELDGRDFA